MLLKGECVAALTEVLIVAQSRFQIDALQFAQFGGGFKLIRQFRPYFVEALSAAVAAYPDAKVGVEAEGIVMHPSRPPIGKAV